MSLSRRAMFGLTTGTLGGAVSRFLITPAEAQSSTILNLTTRSPVVSTDSVVLATAGANWQATLASVLSTAPSATNWSPTLTAAGGAITATTVYAFYYQYGKIITAIAVFSITIDNGTGSLSYNLPFATDATFGASVGVAIDTQNGTLSSVSCAEGASTVKVQSYQGAYPTVGGGGSDFLRTHIDYRSA